MPAQPPPQTSTSVLSVLLARDLPAKGAAAVAPAAEARNAALAVVFTNSRREVPLAMIGFMMCFGGVR